MPHRRSQDASCPPPPSSAGSAESSRSMPFCDVSRLIDTEQQPWGSRRRPIAPAEPPCSRHARQPVDIERRCEMRIARRIPHVCLDAVENAGQNVGARAQQAIHPHATRRGTDLRGIGGRDSGNPVGKPQSGLQISDIAIVFDALDVNASAGKPERGNRCAGNRPWKARLWIVITVGGPLAPS